MIQAMRGEKMRTLRPIILLVSTLLVAGALAVECRQLGSSGATM